MDRRRLITNAIKLFLLLLTACLFLTIVKGSTNGSSRGESARPNQLAKPADTEVETKASLATAITFHVENEVKAFFGKRPDARTVANASAIIEACTGAGPDGWRDTRNCVNYLRYRQDEYHSVDTTSSEARCDATKPVKYHTYWRGPPTTRVSFMLKSFLFTQNLKCSQMHIWLDADHNSAVVDEALESIFLEPFLPLISSGLIVLRSWSYPRKIYIPQEHQIDDFGSDNMLLFQPHKIPSGAVAVSDSVRFIVLHQEGGFYVDMDTMFLRDVRPLLVVQNLSFAERWAAHSGAGEYNTAYLRLVPHSPLSSFVLQGAARMGLNFHPRVVGRMLAKTGRQEDLRMFETALFDPLWSEFDRERSGICCTPCLTDFAQFYKGQRVVDEWITLDTADAVPKPQGLGNVEVANLNRTLSNFYVGAYAHHIHNQWTSQVEVGSWIWAADQTYNQFFQGQRPNLYGEYWHLASMKFPADEALYIT